MRCDPQMVITPLFVPADRPDWYAKAAQSGADALVFDLEDGVQPGHKAAARDALLAQAPPDITWIVRINGVGTPWHGEDLQMLSRIAPDAVMVPKCQSVDEIVAVGRYLGRDVQIIAAIESAVGLANAAAIAANPRVSRLTFGVMDFAFDISCSADWDSLLAARSAIVLASRLGGVPSPIDGATLQIDDPQRAEVEARKAARLGFSGKFCVHPRQVAPVRTGFMPRDDTVAWAERVVQAKSSGPVRIDGALVDQIVVRRAEKLLARHRSMRLR
jgi:citrate lyase subunit beta / citryl-CoA lyase